MASDDFRVAYLQEAMKCLRFSEGGQNIFDMRSWFNLMGAIANAVVASVPDSVAEGLQVQRERQRVVHDHLSEKLKGV